MDLAETVFYARLKRWIAASAHGIRAYSTGRIHGYIGFVLVTLVVALLLFAKGLSHGDRDLHIGENRRPGGAAGARSGRW